MAQGSAFERERRFLVHDTGIVEPHAGNIIVQAYLYVRDDYAVRVRRTYLPDEAGGYHEGPALLAVKGPRSGGTREEHEMELPVPLARELIDRSEHKVTKLRYQIVEGAHVWDVDVFSGSNEGLVIAECEASDLSAVVPPDWVAEEITEDARYNNENLAVTPYGSWG
ncbi:CYTH domain-containing protein [Symbioplanes lichenis]|uniref:CYTH domain-containing protein n=1 Tax=Symbioplanes lichenis TaxID=1629072 RepID=UPI002739DE3E|nr:hypothetical protein [Actinoplanes lichenis]